MDNSDKFIAAINAQKGELTALTCLARALLMALPTDLQARALAEFDVETSIARDALVNSPLPDQVLDAFDHHVAVANSLRLPPT